MSNASEPDFTISIVERDRIVAEVDPERNQITAPPVWSSPNRPQASSADPRTATSFFERGNKPMKHKEQRNGMLDEATIARIRLQRRYIDTYLNHLERILRHFRDLDEKQKVWMEEFNPLKNFEPGPSVQLVDLIDDDLIDGERMCNAMARAINGLEPAGDPLPVQARDEYSELF
jgi:hypothetical protein